MNRRWNQGMVVLYIYVLHQNEGGIGKSIHNNWDISRNQKKRFSEGEAWGKSGGPWVINPIPRDGSVDQLVLTVLKSIRPF